MYDSIFIKKANYSLSRSVVAWGWDPGQRGWKGMIQKGPEGTFRGGSYVYYLGCGNGFMGGSAMPKLVKLYTANRCLLYVMTPHQVVKIIINYIYF